MCSGYGVRVVEAAEERPERTRVRFEPFEITGGDPDSAPSRGSDARERFDAWAGEHGGRARITGRIARNLNPLVHELNGERELVLAWWWLHTGGSPAGYSAFNSRDDRLLQSWRGPFRRRALLPADWYVEKGRTFALPGGQPFAIAAITAPAPQPDDPALLSYSMVTRGAVGAAAETHPRMPLVLPPEMYGTWLDPARAGDTALIGEALAASDELSRALEPAADSPVTKRAPGPAPQPTLF